MIKSLIPEGTQERKFGDALNWSNPTNIVDAKEYDPSYPTPVLTANSTFILGYTKETNNIFHASPADPVIIFDDFTTEVKWVDFPFKIKSGAMKFFKSKNNDLYSLRFLYYSLLTHPFRPTTHQRHQAKIFALSVPLPDLPTQLKIVEILDAHEKVVRLQEERVRLLKLQRDVLLDRIFSIED